MRASAAVGPMAAGFGQGSIEQSALSRRGHLLTTLRCASLGVCWLIACSPLLAAASSQTRPFVFLGLKRLGRVLPTLLTEVSTPPSRESDDDCAPAALALLSATAARCRRPLHVLARPFQQATRRSNGQTPSTEQHRPSWRVPRHASAPFLWIASPFLSFLRTRCCLPSYFCVCV